MELCVQCGAGTYLPVEVSFRPFTFRSDPSPYWKTMHTEPEEPVVVVVTFLSLFSL